MDPCESPAALRGVLVPDDSIGRFAACWYTSALDALGEPDIRGSASGSGTTIRFLWLRTFHQPVSVRLSRVNGVWQVRYAASDGQGGYSPGNLNIVGSLTLTSAQEDTLAVHLSRTEFWTAPTKIPTDGMDGAEWIFEWRAGDRYALRQRWNPEAGDPFRSLGLWLVGLAGSRLPVEPVY